MIATQFRFLAQSWLGGLKAAVRRRLVRPPKNVRILQVLAEATEPLRADAIGEKARIWTPKVYAYLRMLSAAELVSFQARSDALGLRGGRPSFWYSITTRGRDYLRGRGWEPFVDPARWGETPGAAVKNEVPSETAGAA